MLGLRFAERARSAGRRASRTRASPARPGEAPLHFGGRIEMEAQASPNMERTSRGSESAALTQRRLRMESYSDRAALLPVRWGQNPWVRAPCHTWGRFRARSAQFRDPSNKCSGPARQQARQQARKVCFPCPRHPEPPEIAPVLFGSVPRIWWSRNSRFCLCVRTCRRASADRPSFRRRDPSPSAKEAGWARPGYVDST